MSFHKGGYYAINMGLDVDNVLRIGGWSAPANLWQLTNDGNCYASGAFRAPIFYDSDNSAYYGDFASTSVLNDLTISGTGSKYLRIISTNAQEAMVYYEGSTGTQWYVGKRITAQLVGTADFHWYNVANNNTMMGLTVAGELLTRGGMYAPAFYDIDNPAYFLNPNGTSNLTNVVVGYNGGAPPYSSATSGSLYFATSGDPTYSIYTQVENIGGPYTKLTIDWHTGIRIGSYPTYGGTRFYNNAVAGGGSKVFSVNEGDSNTRVYNALFSPIYYDLDNSAYYLDPAGTSKLNNLVINSVYTGNKYTGNGLSVTTVFQDVPDFSIAGVYIPTGVNRVTFWYNASARQYVSGGLNHCAFRLRVVNDQTGAVTYIGHADWGFGIMRQNDATHSWWQYNQSVVIYPAWSDTGNAGNLQPGYSYTFYLQCRDIYDNEMYIGAEVGGTFVGYSPVQGIIWVS